MPDSSVAASIGWKNWRMALVGNSRRGFWIKVPNLAGMKGLKGFDYDFVSFGTNGRPRN
jgi:hypothetical protein